MSRSPRRGRCGRGCGVCRRQTAPAVRRTREADAAHIDAVLEPDNVDARQDDEPYVCSAPPGACEGCGDRHLPPDEPTPPRVALTTLGEIVTAAAARCDARLSIEARAELDED